MHHPANHLRGRGGHRHRLAGSSRAILGIVVQPLGCAELPFPWCSAGRARSTFFSKTFSARRPPASSPPFFLTTPSRLSRQNGGRQRALTGCRVAAPPREALPAAVHFLVGWLEPGGSARGGGAAGQSPPGAPGISWWAGGCPTRPRLSLQRRLLSPTQAAPRRDNVAGLVAGRPPSSHLKWVPPGCCLAGRRGDRGAAGRGGSAWLSRRPEFLLFPTPGHRVSGLGVGDAFSAPAFFSFREFMKRFPRSALDDGFGCP